MNGLKVLGELLLGVWTIEINKQYLSVNKRISSWVGSIVRNINVETPSNNNIKNKKLI